MEQMKGVGLRSVEGPPSLTKSRSSPALGSLSSQNASQALWESKVLDSRLPNGFYSVIPVSLWHFACHNLSYCVPVRVCCCCGVHEEAFGFGTNVTNWRFHTSFTC